MNFIWYSKISNTNTLEQGDLIPNCPVIIPPVDLEIGSEPEIEVELIDSIILSQSCDLENDKIQIVLVCPFMPLKTFIENTPQEQQTSKAIKKNIENLRKGFLPGYHLLNKSKDMGIYDYLVVDFRNVYGIHVESLKSLVAELGTRVRLMPPYKEHLSQAFARYFMRVGLPQDIKIENY